MHSQIQAKIEEAKTTKYLELRNQGLKEIPKEVFDIEGLWFLIIENIVALDSHEAHYYNYNEIYSIPSEIKKLKELIIFHASSVGLEELPEEIGELENLVRLDIHNNNITKLPTSFGKLDNLYSKVIVFFSYPKKSIILQYETLRY